MAGYTQNAPGAFPLVISETAIRLDQEGRYCLNDLHKASGGENRHRPSMWAENSQVQELIAEIAKAGIPALVSIKGGTAPGTFVVKELVYAYAMWISPAFHLKVIRAYDALATSQPAAPSMALPASGEAGPETIAIPLRRYADLLELENGILKSRLTDAPAPVAPVARPSLAPYAGRPGIESARWIADLIVDRRAERLTLREIHRAYKRWRTMDEDQRRAALALLEESGWIAPEKRKRGSGPIGWRVNPAVHAEARP